MNRFIDDLLREKIFHCSICDELCTSDVFLVKGKGNVCAKCLQLKSGAELNTPLMLIMAKLIFPCEFQSKGCKKRIESKKYSEHVASCKYKTKPCPMKNIESCDWNGSNFEVSGHLLKNHQGQVIKSGNSIFKVETSLSEPFNVKILSDEYQNCLLKTSVVDDKFYYALSPLDKSEENVEYSVVHKSIQTPNHSVLKTLGTLTKLNGFYDEENLDKNPNATVVDIDLLKHLADEKNMISNEFNLNPKGIDEDMLKLLECPVCLSTMRPPIYQCNRGHSICIICREKVSACPTCQAEWTNSRNFFMENFTTNVKYPCKFKKFGCKDIGVEGEIKKHEETCLLNCNIATKEQAIKSLRSCRFYSFGCKDKGVESEIIKHEESCGFYSSKCPMCSQFLHKNDISGHALQKHNDVIMNLYYKYHRISKSLTEHVYKVYTVFDGKLFKVSYQYHQEDIYIYFALELICSNENPSLYTYDIIFSSSQARKPFVLKSTCVKESPQTAGSKITGDVKIPKESQYDRFNVAIKRAN